jgi:hypothetical protein
MESHCRFLCFLGVKGCKEEKKKKLMKQNKETTTITKCSLADKFSF